MVERLFIRILVTIALCLALVALVLAPLPVDAQGNPDLPAPAFEQVSLYRLEVALLVFYGELLLVTPVFSGLAHSRLPIEISTRGAKFAEWADQSAAQDEAAIMHLEGITKQLTGELDDAKIHIDTLKELAESDSTQPKVDSKR
jgi:hypothetical protein